jgi:hypothetical protein
MRINESVAGIEGVASGAEATVKLPNNRRYHLLKLYAQGTNSTPATVYAGDVIDTVKIYVGTRLIRQVTAAELLFFAAFNGYTLTQPGSSVPIVFSDPRRASVMDEQMTAFELFGSPEMTLKVGLKSGLTGVSLRVIQCYDDGFTTVNGQRVRNIIKQDPQWYSAGSTYDIMGTPLGFPINRIFLFPESGKAITSVKVVVNESQTVYEMTAAENQAFLADYGLISETGNGKCFPIVFDMNQQLLDGLPVVKSLRITVTQSAAGQIKALTEIRTPDYL